MSSTDQYNSFNTHIKSFVIRNTRLTKGQKRALELLFPLYSLSLDDPLHLQFEQPHQPLVIEVGCGTGEATVEWALNHPEWNFVAVDVYKSGIGELTNNIHKNNCKNIKIAMIDIIELFKKQKSMGWLCDRIHVFFPDPWPKRKHHKRKLIQSHFINLGLEFLNNGGFFLCITDDSQYAVQISQLLESIPNLKKETLVLENRPQTKYEKRATQIGSKISELLYRKKD